MSEQNKAIVRRFFDAFTSNDQASLQEVLAPDFVIHVPDMGAIDRETHVRGIGGFNAAFSHLRGTIEDQIAEADRVATRLTWRGTHTGEFHGLAPSGNNVAVSAIDIARIEGGRIVERWFTQDELGLMRQVGAIPS